MDEYRWRHDGEAFGIAAPRYLLFPHLHLGFPEQSEQGLIDAVPARGGDTMVAGQRPVGSV
jgi:hypothetical protein